MAAVPLLAKVPPVISPAAYARLRNVLFVLALLPLARLFYLGFAGRLGANPVEFVTRSLGTWALVLLLITLCVSPLRWATGWAWPLRLRRMFGLLAFSYALLHVASYVWLDHYFDFAAVWADIVKRPYITIGMGAFLLLVPLAATSTNGWVRRLGGKNWQRLHRLVYLIAPAAVLHFWWQKTAKNDTSEPLIYGAIVAVLLGVRVLHWMRTHRYGKVDSSANKSATDSRRRTQ